VVSVVALQPSNWDDPDRPDVYAAEDDFVEQTGVDMLPRVDVPGFVAQVLADAGLDIPLPVLVFDLPRDLRMGGYHHSPTGEIHLRDEPKIDAELVLHEVAHHIVGSRPSHGIVFRSCLAMLVEAVCGPQERDLFCNCLRERGLDVFMWHRFACSGRLQ